MPNAECDLGECCEKCKLLGGSHVCRSNNSNECDFAEYCNGTSPHVCWTKTFLALLLSYSVEWLSKKKSFKVQTKYLSVLN